MTATPPNQGPGFEPPHGNPQGHDPGQGQPPGQPQGLPPGPPPGQGQPQGYGYGYPPAPAGPPGTTQDERTWALASHIGSILGAWLAMAFLVPLAVMLVKGDNSAYVRHHSVESLNFQLSMLLYLVVGVLLSVFTLGVGLIVVIPAGIVLGVLWLVFVVMATVKASNGESYRYPLTIRFVK